MSPEIAVVNRQRKHRVDVEFVEKAAQSILIEILADLKSNPCDWLSLENVIEIEGRGCISVALVSDRRIKELNSQWRGKNYATDVLSFPIDLEPPEEEMEFDVGELIISMDRTKAQAIEYGHSEERELAFLLAHGFLHLLGFDHESEEDEKEMFGRQRLALEKAGFPRN